MRRLISRLRFGPAVQDTPRHGYEPRPSFAAAAAEAGPGYSDPALMTVFHNGRGWLEEGVADFAATLFSSVAAAALATDGKLKVLDFGGSSGYLRSYVNTFFQNRIATDWLIVETQAQVDHVGDLGLDDVRYASSIPPERFDLAIFSGSLHFIPEWQALIASLDAEMIYIARTPIADKEQAYVQRTTTADGHQVRYAGLVISRDELFSVLEKTHRLHCLWKLDAHLLEMGVHEAPAMLWQRQPR